MTEIQRQCLLVFLGYDTGGIGNGWGEQSREATARFQADFGLNPDGVPGEVTDKALTHAVAYGMPAMNDTDINVGNKTGTFWDEIDFFTRDEFKCQCFRHNNPPFCDGFPVEPQEKMVRTVNEIRRRLGVPVTIVESGGSGVRCTRHNASPQAGGVANSLHLTGNAADLHSSKSPEEMARVAEEVMGKTGEIGIYSWGIHVGIGKYSRFRG